MSRKIALQQDEVAKEFTYGIEIETTVPKAKRMSIGTCSQPKQVRGCPTGWMSKTDSSIHPSNSYKGVEVISPVLQGLDGIKQIEQTTNKLQALGAVANDSCGFHVHVGLPKQFYIDGCQKENETQEYLANLIAWAGKHELALYASTGTITRVGNSYCGSIQMRYNLSDIRTPNNLRETFNRHRERCNVLNIINIFDNYRPDTIEFRVFPGTIDFVSIQGYIQIALGLVRKALGGKCKSYEKRTSTWGETCGYTPGKFALDQLLYSLWWQYNDSNHPIMYGWITEVDKRKEILSQLFKLAVTFDQQIKNRPCWGNQREILKKWYKWEE